jgi:hypothetical protein
VLATLHAGLPPGQAERAAARFAEAFGGPCSSAAAGSLVAAPLAGEEQVRWIASWLGCADEAKLPADPEFRSAFAAYIAWEAAAPAGAHVPPWDWGSAGLPPAASPSASAQAARQSTEPDLPGPGEPLSFARHIKPLFREKDRTSMSFVFDLWSYADVCANAVAILDQVRSGTMPCDGIWAAEKVAVFERWMRVGSPS